MQASGELNFYVNGSGIQNELDKIIDVFMNTSDYTPQLIGRLDNVLPSKLYWVDASLALIKRSNLDGSNVETIINAAGQLPRRVVVHPLEQKIYWTEQIGENIKKADLDGSNIETILSAADGLDDPLGLDLDIVNGKIYWSEPHFGNVSEVKRANLDGSDLEVIIPTASGVVSHLGIALDVNGGKLYWVDSAQFTGDPRIQRSNLDGSKIEDIFVDADAVFRDLTLDIKNGKLYFGDRTTDTVQRMNFDGTQRETIIKTDVIDEPQALAVDVLNNRLYCSDIGDDDIRHARLDGSDVEVLIPNASGVTSVQGIDVIPSVVIQVWDLTNGNNTELALADNFCYPIGNTSRFGWSTENMPVQNRVFGQFLYKMTANNGETFIGEFMIESPSNRTEKHPRQLDDFIMKI